MGLFLSTITNKVDSKGRVSVPASFRAALKDQEFQGVVLYPSFTAPCIEGCGMDFLKSLSEGLDTQPTFSPDIDELTELVFGSSQQLPYDQTGRIVLPRDFMEHAGITDQAAFVGKGRTFQIWEPAAQQKKKQLLLERARKAPPRGPALAPNGDRGGERSVDRGGGGSA
ncbi:division/cell wall cluster transcriptional repressor MraZ [Roseospira marina]|nr:division/cell wall cluster transcriptional repressor MraZ [Roseospira marina]MBB4315313.1 MraZ protein [Roseospira marina]MBB5088312.1 MraZ protein [Roseospira marina]